jgi:nickel/cobalt exporter
VEDGGLAALLLLGFGLGLVHALDADHVMAVSALASLRPGLRTSLSFAARWALGHGGFLLAVGAVAFALGVAVPPAFSRTAETAVGILMVGLGSLVLFDLRRRRAHLHYHQHDGLPPHAHWHTHGEGAVSAHAGDPHRHRHGAVLVGALHGAAGSAPLLALVPAVAQGSAAVGLAYLLCFGVGVFASMLVFGGLFGALVERALRSGRVWPLRAVQSGSAVGAIAVGALLIRSSW